MVKNMKLFLILLISASFAQAGDGTMGLSDFFDDRPADCGDFSGKWVEDCHNGSLHRYSTEVDLWSDGAGLQKYTEDADASESAYGDDMEDSDTLRVAMQKVMGVVGSMEKSDLDNDAFYEEEQLRIMGSYADFIRYRNANYDGCIYDDTRDSRIKICPLCREEVSKKKIKKHVVDHFAPFACPVGGCVYRSKANAMYEHARLHGTGFTINYEKGQFEAR